MADVAHLPPPKLSRYRSVRHARARSTQEPPVPPPEHSNSEVPSAGQLSRTPSRYRRPTTMPSMPLWFPALKTANTTRPHNDDDDDSTLSTSRDDESKYSDPTSSISEFHPGYRSKSSQGNVPLFSSSIPESPLMESTEAEEPQDAQIPLQAASDPVQETHEDTRQVTIELGNTKMKINVTPQTTSADMIAHSSKAMSDRIRPKSTILLESFRTVGVQRPLRLYESISTVMNSWDVDDQNSLILLDPGTGSIEPELTLSGAPRERPEEMSWMLHYSQKPGTWAKRAVTLHSDGRMSVRKDIHKPQDAVGISHISDSDIYRPSQEKSRTKIKPPKKFCFAVKSQQKTAVFESTLDFVHFFCTDDKATAKSFYSAVQAWRSWYLVHVLGAGKSTKAMQLSTTAHNPNTDRIRDNPLAQHPPTNPHTENQPPQPPTSRSNRFLFPSTSIEFSKSSNQFDTTVSPERRGGAILKARHRAPPTKNPPAAAILKDDEPLANINHKLSLSNSTPTTISTQPLHQENKPPPPSQSKTTTTSSSLTRHQSRRAAPTKPLVDLTPQYQPPPQHARKGRGFVPENVGAGGLVASATSPEDPIGVPGSRDWQAGRNPAAAAVDANPEGLRRFKSLSASAKSPKIFDRWRQGGVSAGASRAG